MSGVVLISTAEFVLKSQPVRIRLARQLKHHLRFSLKRIGQESYSIRPAGGLLVIDGLKDAEPVANSLAKVLGVSHADACERTSTDPSAIVERVVKLAERTVKNGETFAVRARRFEPSQLKGKEIEIRAGSEILARALKGVSVNLDNPDHTFRVFYGARDAYVSTKRFNGPGGLPVGSQGSLLGLATDPALAPLAFYLLMKRGAMVWPVIADLPSLSGVPPDQTLQGLKRLRQCVPKNTYSARVVTVDDSTRTALTAVSLDLRRIFCMRLVFRVVKHLARNALGLVTADRFGRDGIESLKDLRPADEVATFPVYRPLLMLDEAEMRRQLEELGLIEHEAEKIATQALPSSDEGLIDGIRTLENSLQADELAYKIAADSRKMQIEFP